MNSSFALEPISQDNLLVWIALGIIAVLAAITIFGMIWGARLKRRRDAAEIEEQRRIEDLEASGVQATNVPGDAPAPPGPAQSAPTSTPAPAPAPRAADAPAQQPPIADEPIAAAAPLDASPAAAAADTPGEATAPTQDGATPVTVLKGLGPKIATRLAELGITTVDQLAWLDDAEAAQLDAQLGAFQGRMERDRWREQARFLAQGDRAGFEAQFGKLG